MTEQHYRVIADKDTTPDLVSTHAAPGDRLVYDVIDADRWSLVRIERPLEDAEPSVPPPTREQIAEAIYTARAGSNKNWHKAAFRDDYLEQADAVLALFPQPAPSAEQIETLRQLACDGSGVCQSPLHAHGCYSDLDVSTCDEPTEHPSAKPVRMTQGMTFTAHPPARQFIYRGGGTYRDEITGVHVSANAFDPSTIRDVTPPPATHQDH